MIGEALNPVGSVARRVGAVFVIMLCGVHGCCLDAVSQVAVTGSVLDADSSAPISGAVIGGRYLLNGEVLAEIPTFLEGQAGFQSAEDGTFVFEASRWQPVCPWPNTIAREPPLPIPDQIELFVVHDDCEQSFLIDVEAETIIAPDTPLRILELRDPIMVEPCN